MLIPKLDTFRPQGRVGAISCPGTSAPRSTRYRIYRNGVLYMLAEEAESAVRNRVINFSNQHPEDSWDYAPAA